MKIDVQHVQIAEPLTAVGKIFYGDYGNSPQYILAVQSELDKHNIAWKKNKVFGVFYDDPQGKPAADLKSYHGVFLIDYTALKSTSLTPMVLTGSFLYAKTIGSFEDIYNGYKAIFEFASSKRLKLKSQTGYQISSFDHGVITTEIYMEL